MKRSILLFWTPLAITWMFMALEGPFLAALVARLADPGFNLAAYGVAFAFAVLVEAPVIMLMSASTALVRDQEMYRRLLNFTHVLSAGTTAVLLLVLVPPLYGWLTRGLLGLPESVALRTYDALWLLLPWPAAIGYRRFFQGLLIRAGQTRLVALGTLVRLVCVVATGLLASALLDLPGASVGALALSAGVITEAVAARLMVRRTIAALRSVPGPDDGEGRLGYVGITRFYVPLALTSVIGLTVQPMLTFFMGRAPAPVESLAVFPVVHALSFLFRALGLSYQEAAIALVGSRFERAPEVARFGVRLGVASSVGLAIVAFTPLARFWFETVSGLTPELAAFALAPTMILVPLPALSVLLSYQRAVLVAGRRTRPITTATIIEVGVVALVFAIVGWQLRVTGVTAAFLAFLAGRLCASLYLLRPAHRMRIPGASPDRTRP